MIRESTGLAAPDFPVPAGTPQAVDLTPYPGRCRGPTLTYEVGEPAAARATRPAPPGFSPRWGTLQTVIHSVETVTSSRIAGTGSTPMPGPVGTSRCPSFSSKGAVMSVA